MTPDELEMVLAAIASSPDIPTDKKWKLVAKVASGVSSGTQPQEVKTPTSDDASIPAPVPPLDPGLLLTAAGRVCRCTTCLKDVLKIVVPIYTTMRLSEFRACFEPVLEPTNSTWSDPHGNVAVDCPLCKALKTVWIIGKEGLPYADVPDGDPDRPVVLT